MTDLSIIIPVHNESARLPAAVEKLAAPIQPGITTEIILVENGSTDNTLEIAQAASAANPAIRVLSLAGRGKGAALRAGMLAARGAWRYMADCDFSTPFDWIDIFWSQRLTADIVIGDRENRASRRIGEPWRRHISGRVFNALVQALAVPGCHDTQCGFKLFSARAAQDLFTRSMLDSMALDVELLFLARRRGYTVKSIPVIWYYDTDSRVRFLHDTAAMVGDILAIRQNALFGLYDYVSLEVTV